MGVVYEAFDRERGHSVALKTLYHFNPGALYRFKQEFRTLADVQHPNLVRLYELVVTETDSACFAMELVRGVDFLQHVRKLEAGATQVPADIDKLRPALRQLVQGVHALHLAGKLHRDIKPSNVLVAGDGRVVILDFGVATELTHPVDRHPSEGHEMVGTATYMAPEQAYEEAPVPASDWYSVGVVLYEALVGRPPFLGSSIDVLSMKTQFDPRPPSECVEGVPPDLDTLCRILLDRDPARRPTGLEILQRLGVAPDALPIPSLLPLANLTSLVGRETQLRALRDAFERALSGHSVTVAIGGESGMGKSAVAQHFLDGLVRSGEAVVLRGRAYERETVPYKAFDGVIDALSLYLIHLEDEHDPVRLPADIAALARIFPVLRRVPSIHEVAEEAVADPLMLRRRAFAALRELLGSLATRRPVVLYVDDVQWGDADSASLLLELVRPPQAPPVLFVLTCRDREAKPSAFLRAMRDRWSGEEKPTDVTVGPLTAEEGCRFALELLDASDPSAQRVANAVARESRGSPFLIEELVRTNRSAMGRADGDTLQVLTLDQMVTDRMERLSPSARRLLEIVAVGGRPLPVSVVAEAAGIGENVEEAIAAARARRFLHSGPRDGKEVVETSHDRFRETIVAQLGAERVREHHGSLAKALEAAPGADAEAIAMHLLGAGQRERAATFAEKAADDAAAKLAFDQAERLLRMTLDILPSSAPGVTRVQTRLGEVLEWAGRGADAARVYLAAAETAPTERRVELQRAAAEQLLNCGRMDEGTLVLRRVLPAVGLQGPRSPAGAVFWLLVYRLWGAILGARYQERDPAAIRPEDRVRIDALYAVAMGFSLVDVILGACMQARHLVLALRAGDRFQALRALSLETSHLASEGGPEGKREQALIRVATEIVGRIDAEATVRGGAGPSVGEMHGPAFYHSNRGVSLFLRGRWKQAREALDVAYARTQNHHAGWQVNANLFGAYALYELGEITELAARVRRLMSEAEQRGDLYTSVNLQTTMGVVLSLAADEPEAARRGSREAMAQWSQRGFLVQHMQTMVYQTRIELYLGNGEQAYERMVRDWTALKKSFLLHVQFIRGFTLSMRGYSAVAAAAAATPGRRTALLKEARRIVRRLERERMLWMSSHACLIAAAVANAEGDGLRTVASLRSAMQRADAADMPLHSEVARYALGSRIEGATGQELTRQAADGLATRGVRCIPRFVAMYLPGRWESSR